MTEFLALPPAGRVTVAHWLDYWRGCSGNVCCIERKPQLVQSLDHPPAVGLTGGAWVETELERHILMSHSAEVAISLVLSVCLAFA